MPPFTGKAPGGVFGGGECGEKGSRLTALVTWVYCTGCGTPFWVPISFSVQWSPPSFTPLLGDSPASGSIIVAWSSRQFDEPPMRDGTSAWDFNTFMAHANVSTYFSLVKRLGPVEQAAI